MIQLLDCTLREAPIDDFFVGDKLMREFIYRCENVGINIIECGFLKDVDYVEGSNCFRTVEQIQKYIPNKKPEIMYVALMDYGRYDLENLSEYDGTSIDGIRICFKYGQQQKAIETGKRIKEKGYKVFIQHVDTLAYTDIEIIEFIKMVNELKPEAYAIVDTFGSMYADDLDRLTMLIDYHLDKSIALGFHSHNNLMLANSNAQSFISRFASKRSILIDGSVLGCGRGAGNAHTELLAEYLNKKYNYEYNVDELLDLIDSLMPQFQRQCTWGYNIPYFLSGVHSAHVYNANYLLRRHNIASKDLRAIIEKLDNEQKKNYDYKLLESLYVEYFNHPINDSSAKRQLRNHLKNQELLLLAPGKTLKTEKTKIFDFIKEKRPIVIGLNNKNNGFEQDYIFFSSSNRYRHYCYEAHEVPSKLIITSNILQNSKSKNELVIDYISLIKFGWVNIDSAMILLLRLVLSLGCTAVYLAGFDGFSEDNAENFYSTELITDNKKEDLLLMTKENGEMLADIIKSYPDAVISFVTTSKYKVVLEE